MNRNSYACGRHRDVPNPPAGGQKIIEKNRLTKAYRNSGWCCTYAYCLLVRMSTFKRYSFLMLFILILLAQAPLRQRVRFTWFADPKMPKLLVW
jgi:hypothetical protein